MATCLCMPSAIANGFQLSTDSNETLSLPELTDGAPAAGKRVAVNPPEYSGTGVFHTLYLPIEWKPNGESLPIIFEYTGNYFPQSGSTGRPEDASLGFGLSDGKYIWVSLPYVNEAGDGNQVTWWGDEEATVEYAKRNVPRIIRQFNADPNAVFLCGFSRGAIGVNYLGLRDDEIASLWTAFIAHDHFDGVKEWSTAWGSPLEQYRSESTKRLARVRNRPYWVSQNGSSHATEQFVRSTVADATPFTFGYVDTEEILGPFPNELAKSSHTDRWAFKPSEYRNKIRAWMNTVTRSNAGPKHLGDLIFEDHFERSESQDEKDEPGNAWTTSSDTTAAGHKQVDLRDGSMHIFTHAVANHATSVRHAFAFEDGSIGMRFRLNEAGDSLKLNFADLACKSVHAGHLFDVDLRENALVVEDRKTGVMDLKMRALLNAQSMTREQRAELATRKKQFPIRLKLKQWHEVMVHVAGDEVSVEIDGKPAGSHHSSGYAHPTKSLLRLLVLKTADVDDVQIWRRTPSNTTATKGPIGAATLDFKSMIRPVPASAKFIDEGFYIWGASMVRDTDGKCHLLYSRWPRELGHNAWVTHSEIAHAVSDHPLGPYRHVDVALPARGAQFWDGMCTHNPTVHAFDGKYYLYYMGNFGDGNATQKLNPIHRNHQRIGVAVADHPAGPWRRFDKPLIDVTPEPGADDELMTSNPSILRRSDGTFVFIYKAVGTKGQLPFGGPVVHLAATSMSPTGPFKKRMKPLFTAPGVKFPAEDPFVWADGDRCWAIVNDHKGHFNGTGEDSLALFTSLDGLDWEVATNPWVLQRKLTWAEGTEQSFHRLERPQLWLENGVPTVLFCAAEETQEKTHSFNVQIPLRIPKNDSTDAK
ncbi:Glycosyl hydrolases family 43 [Rubripirellula tenax]|uniref:Glycosyl hydrolases family 43 n=1 Tax=Rubripirellula tenax TaxID=2528015 RepID=A0A5C6F2E1_9BACT|nr:glycoside hydrolase family protein [Rubripirellula tenax]TWU54690.1 Glycosyl hydrolases family 43 [Rubripirellula tenax]